jgi:trimeric autotransporter adhesin
VTGLQQSVAGLQNQVNAVHREERRGIAAVAAMPPMLTPSAPGRFTVAVGGGFFQNQGGVGVTAAYRFDAPIPVYAAASYANGGGSQNVFRAMGGVEF